MVRSGVVFVKRYNMYMRIVVGLGNPGKEYENTRHNVGFMVVDKLKPEIEGKKILLVKPQKFMNRSGEEVIKVVNFHKVDLANLYVVHDDLDIKLGEYKIQFGKGPKVHNGITSIEQALGTKDFWRVRIGIDNNDVLGKFAIEEKKIVEEVIDEVNKELVTRLQA